MGINSWVIWKHVNQCVCKQRNVKESSSRFVTHVLGKEEQTFSDWGFKRCDLNFEKKYSKRDLRSRAPNITSGANLFSLLKVGWLLRCFQSSIRLGEGFPLSLVCFLPNLTKHIYARVYLTSMGSNLCNFLVGWLLGFQSSIRLGKMCPTFCELILPNPTHLTDWALELIQNVPTGSWTRV